MQRFRPIAERYYHVAALAILFGSFAFAAGLDTSKLKPTGYVNDFAHVIDARSAAQLEAYCGNVERATGAQFAIVTVDSLEDEPVEDVAVRLFKEWGIGKKGTDEGLLLILAIKDHKNRIEVGYGLEPVITDGYAGGVLRGIRPILRQGNYGGALLAAAQQLGQRVAESKGVTIEGQPLRQNRSGDSDGGGSIIGIFVFFLILVFLIRLFSGRGGSGRPGGGSGMGGFLTGMILGNMMGGGRRGGWGG
ncbi:MAG: TPM domain-containing protein [Bryobacteraceae bacterium]